MTLTPNLALLRNYMPEDDLIAGLPAISHFARDGKDLFFINAHHVSGTDNATCNTVRHAFQACKPAFLISEGYPADWGVTSDRMLQLVKQQEQGEFVEGGEGGFAISLADRYGIPFQSGEPTDAQQLATLRAKGHSTLDYVGYDLLLYVPCDLMQGLAADEAGLRRLAEQRLSDGFSYIPASDKPCWNDFLNWLARWRNGDTALMTLTNEENAPSGAADATHLQRLTCAMTRARDEHLLRQITARLNEYGRVLVVYGAGHLVTCRAVLEDMMGVPKVITVS